MASVKASVSSTFLAVAAIWLNTFLPFTLIFISSNIQKRSSSFIVQDFYFYSDYRNTKTQRTTTVTFSMYWTR